MLHVALGIHPLGHQQQRDWNKRQHPQEMWYPPGVCLCGAQLHARLCTKGEFAAIKLGKNNSPELRTKIFA